MTPQLPKELSDLEKFLQGDGTVSRRKVRKSFSSRRGRKAGTKSRKTRRTSQQPRVKVGQRYQELTRKLAAFKKQHA